MRRPRHATTTPSPSSRLRTLAALLRCAHVAPTVAVTAFATALAVAAGRGAGAAWVLVAVLSGQLSVGWANDWLDRGRDAAVGRRDKPLVAGTISPRTVWRAALGALGLCMLASLVSGPRAAIVHLVAVGCGWAYDLGLKSTRASFVPYAVAFGLLPAFITLGPPLGRWPAIWVVVTGALLGIGAHFANVLPDLEEDRRTGVRGLPHRLGAGPSLAVATVALAAGSAAVVVGVERVPLLAAGVFGALLLAVAAVPVTWHLGRPRSAFRLTMLIAGGAVATLLLSGSQLA